MGAYNAYDWDCCCGGDAICVDLTAPCTAGDNVGVTVTATETTTGVVTTGTTDSSGHVCIDVDAGTYDVKATKSSCSTITWDDVAVSGTVNLTGEIACLKGRTIRIFGCYSLPLPGATIQVSGPESATLTSDSGGWAYFYPSKIGDFTVTVSFPGMQNATGTWTQASICTQSTVTFTLHPATGWQCNQYQIGATRSVYPVPNILNLTDAGGTVLYDQTVGSGCYVRTMSDVSGQYSPDSVSCPGGGSMQVPPSDIASGSSSVTYTITLIGSDYYLDQSIKMQTGINNAGLLYHGNYQADGLCSPQETYRIWRVSQGCPASGSGQHGFLSSSFTVNSLHPLLITATFAAGTGFGPSTTGLIPSPYSTTVTIGE